MRQPVKYSVGDSRKCQRWEAAETPWPALAARLCSFARTRETSAEWSAMGRDQRGEIKDVGGFVGAVLAGGRRKSDYVASRTMVTLDLDYAESVEAAERAVLAALPGKAWAMYTTHSHTAESPRLRLVVPLSRPIKPNCYEAVARMVAKQVGIEWMDATTYETARMFYWPSCSADAEPWSKWADGEGLDPYDVLAAYGGRHLEPSAWPKAEREKQQGRSRAAAQQGLDFSGAADPAPAAGGRLEDPLEKGGLVGDFCRAYYPIEEAIGLLLPDVYLPAPHIGKGRYTYANGSTAGGAIAYEHRYLKSHHDSDPANGMHNIFDLVRIHRYGSLDGDESGADAPSYKAMAGFIRSDIETQRRLEAERQKGIERDFGQIGLANEPAVEKKDGENFSDPEKIANFGAEKTHIDIADSTNGAKNDDKKRKAKKIAKEEEDWYSEAVASGAFKPGKQSIQNAYCVLTRDPRLKGRLLHDDFTGRDSVDGDLPWRKFEKGAEAWTDRDEANLRAYLERYGLTSKGQIADAVEQALTRRRRHPVREYLDSLRWDGKPRLERLFIDYLGAEDTPFNRAVTRMHFAAAVARVREPGIKYDYCLTLQGPQGSGKSTSLQIMFGDWFSDSATTTEGKEGMESLRGKWGIEYGELSALTRSEVEQVKAFLTSRSDSYRPAYARHLVTLPRQCVFFATTNQDKYLRGDTGNRRFLTVAINPALRKWPEYPDGETPGYLDALRGVRDQMWAEACAIWAAGIDLRLPADLEEESREQQEALNVDSDDPLAPMLGAFLAEDLPMDWANTPLPRRRNYWRDPDEAKTFAARVPRARFCAAEFVCERLCKEPGDRDYSQLVRRVNRIMAKLPGWQSMTATNHVAKLYGRQRGFQRDIKLMIIDEKDL